MTSGGSGSSMLLGARDGVMTLNRLLVAVPFGVVTTNDPLVAPAGTDATICVADMTT